MQAAPERTLGVQPSLVGYSDRLTVQAGESIGFMVSSLEIDYSADLVQLIHGDENPRGPGFKEREISALGRHPGRQQRLRPGSAVIVTGQPIFGSHRRWTMLVWAWPTRPGTAWQGLMGHWDGSRGVRMLLGPDGDFALEVADSMIRTERPLRAREWYLLAVSADASSGRLVLHQIPLLSWASDPTRISIEKDWSGDIELASPAVPFVIGCGAVEPGTQQVQAAFNGKLEGPAVLARPIEVDRLQSLVDGGSIGAQDDPLAAWDFSLDIGSQLARDISPYGRHGQLLNGPARGVRSRTWDGRIDDFRIDPRQYAAIEFHDDDLDDARWERDFEYVVPHDLPSGVYAARIRAGHAEDHLPFVVRPPTGRPSAPMAVLLPTYTYVAYANDHSEAVPPSDRRWKLLGAAPFAESGSGSPADNYVQTNRLLSLYDFHSDGSGVRYSSRLRPMLNIRPTFRYRQLAAPARFSADLYIIDWLTERGHSFDVITDEDLDREGQAILEPYSVVMTGTHPEYATLAMLDGLEEYRAGGGSIMAMGGNSFYWVTSVDPARPHVIEVRRQGGTGPFETPPGETHHSTTGEIGGVWRNRGRAPQRLVGVGFSASGLDRGTSYERQTASFAEEGSWVFAGVDSNTFGGGASLVLGSGAAGYEMDRLDYSLGTPPDALLLATSVGHPSTYRPAVEELELATDWPLCDTSQSRLGIHPVVRADMVLLSRIREGNLFSTGSIGWSACLSENGYENDVSRITENVLSRWVARDSGDTVGA